MLESFYEKVKRCLKPTELASIVLESFSKNETIRLMTAEGVFYPGIRMESIDYSELALGWAEDALGDPSILSTLAKALDKVHWATIEKIRFLSVESIHTLLEPIPKLCDQKKVGDLVWALIKDDRPEMEAMMRDFLGKFYRYLDKQHKESVKQKNFGDHLFSGKLNKKETERVKEILADLIEENKTIRASMEKESRDNKKLCDQVGDLKKRLSGRESEIVSFRNDLARFRNEAAQRNELIRALEEKIKTASAGQERERVLQSRVHDIERESRKMEYQISSLSRELDQAETDLRAKNSLCDELEKNLKFIREENQRLSDRLALFSSETDKVVSGPPPAEKTPPRKEKGRRLGIFVDTRALRQACRLLGVRTDFRKLLDLVVQKRHLVKAVAYVIAAPEGSAGGFVSLLEKIGFQVRVRNAVRFVDGSSHAGWGAGIAADVISSTERMELDVVHLAGGDEDFIDLIRFLKAKGVRVEVSGFRVNTGQGLGHLADEFLCLDDEAVQDRVSE